MVNNFALNERESRKHRELMNLFYQCRYPGSALEYYDGIQGFAEVTQKVLHIDGVISFQSGLKLSFEEKLVSKPHTAMYLETDSCSLAGLHTDGWARDSMADLLVYTYTLPFGLYIYALPFREQFQPWFWHELKVNKRPWKEHRNPEENQSQGRLVPLTEIHKAFPNEPRYLIRFEERTCEATKLDMDTVLSLFDPWRKSQQNTPLSFQCSRVGGRRPSW